MRNSLVMRMSRLQIAKSNPIRVMRTERICRPGFIKDISNKFDGEKKHQGCGMAKLLRVNENREQTEPVITFHPDCFNWERVPLQRNYDGSISGQCRNISVTFSGYSNTLVNAYISGGF